MTDRHVPSAYADIATALAASVANDKIILEAAGSPFTGANNRGITPAVNNIILKGATGDPADVVVNLQFANRFLSAGASTDWTVKDLSVINGQVNGPGAFQITPTAARWKIDNVLINNCRALTGPGGAIYLDTGGVPGCELTNLIICACQAADVGGAIRHIGGAAKLKNILMVNNFCLYNGGGLSCENAEDSTYEYLTFLTNASTGADGGGLGINSAAEGLYTFWNCIWWENDAAGLGDQIYTRAPSLGVDLKYCLCTDVFNAIIGACTYSNRLLFDPLFTGGVAPDNAHLSQIASGQASDSDCLDSGSETAAAAGLDTRSTRTDGQTDIGQVDRGFHYYTDEPPPPPDHTVTFTTDGTPGASLTGTNPQIVPHGSSCTPVQANAPIGYHFTEWTLLGVPYSVANPLTVLNVTDDMTIQANFLIDEHTVTFTTDGTIGATITGTNPQTVDYGDDCTAVTAHAPPNYHFSSWTIGGVFYSGSAVLTVLNVTDDMTIQANFTNRDIKFNSVKPRGCFNCDHFQPYGIAYFGECRAHPPKRCCPGMSPATNNFPQIDAEPREFGAFWCDEWKRRRS